MIPRGVRTSRARAAVAGVLTVSVAALSGCTGSAAQPEPIAPFVPPAVAPVKALGPSEGQVTVLARDGYIDTNADWIRQFTRSTGCAVQVTPFSTSAGFAAAAVNGRLGVDVASVPGEYALGLIGTGAVAPVNGDLIPAAQGITPALQKPAWSSWAGIPYGLAVARDYLAVRGGTGLSDVFGSSASGAAVLDTPVMLAAAALGIDGVTDPFSLDRGQLAAAAGAVQQGRVTAVAAPALAKSASVAYLPSAAAGSTATAPTGGNIGASDSWMFAATPAHPNCAYRFVDAALAPAANRAMAAATGQEPSVAAACASDTSGPCAKASDAEFWAGITFARTPLQPCLNQRPTTRCTDWTDWTSAWRAALAGTLTPAPAAAGSSPAAT